MEKDWRAYASGYVDGELTTEERARFEERLRLDPELARELEMIREVKGVTTRMRLKEFPDRVWDRYWEGSYNRLERRFGWFLVSAGAAVLLAFGLYHVVLALIRNDAEPWWLRLAIGSIVAGGAILFVSVARERICSWRRDPYREVKR